MEKKNFDETQVSGENFAAPNQELETWDARSFWNLYLAALLLHFYLTVEKGERTEAEAIKALVRIFKDRRKARLSYFDGCNADVYMQLHTIKLLMTGGTEGIQKSPILPVLKTIVTMYRTNPHRYERYLQAAAKHLGCEAQVGIQAVEPPEREMGRSGEDEPLEETTEKGRDTGKRIPWDIEEAVLLLDALLAVRAGNVPRKEAVTAVSEALRARAEKKGIAISRSFRNETSINIQMNFLENGLTDSVNGWGKKDGESSSRLIIFQKVVALYRNDRAGYETILHKVKAEVPDKKAAGQKMGSSGEDEPLKEAPEKDSHTGKRVLWDMEEAVLLLDALLAVRAGNVIRKDAVAAVSKALRRRAEKKGIAIDSTFRNENGISLQMAVMEYILTDGQKGLDRREEKPSHLSNLFFDTVSLYRNDRAGYEKILHEANASLLTEAGKDKPAESPHSLGGAGQAHGPMGKHTVWNDYSAALLLNTYLDIAAGKKNQKMALQHLEKVLNAHERETGSGVVIHTAELYRQFGLLEHLMTDGKRGLMGTLHACVRNIVNVYTHDNSRDKGDYHGYLEEAAKQYHCQPSPAAETTEPVVNAAENKEKIQEEPASLPNEGAIPEVDKGGLIGNATFDEKDGGKYKHINKESPIEALSIPQWMIQIFKKTNIYTIKDILSCSKEEFLYIYGIGEENIPLLWREINEAKQAIERQTEPAETDGAAPTDIGAVSHSPETHGAEEEASDTMAAVPETDGTEEERREAPIPAEPNTAAEQESPAADGAALPETDGAEEARGDVPALAAQRASEEPRTPAEMNTPAGQEATTGAPNAPVEMNVPEEPDTADMGHDVPAEGSPHEPPFQYKEWMKKAVRELGISEGILRFYIRGNAVSKLRNEAEAIAFLWSKLIIQTIFREKILAKGNQKKGKGLDLEDIYALFPERFRSREKIDQLLHELEEAKRIQIVGHAMYVIYPTLDAYIQNISNKTYREFLNRLLDGQPVEEAAQAAGMARARGGRISQAYLGSVQVMEDRYKWLWEDYRGLSLSDVQDIWRLSDRTARYLALTVPRAADYGKDAALRAHDLQRLADNTELADAIRRRAAEKAEAMDAYLDIDGEKVKKNRQSLLRYFMQTYAREKMPCNVLQETYAQLLSRLGLSDDPDFAVDMQTDRELMEADYTLWSHWKWNQWNRLRYYDIPARTYEKLIDELGLTKLFDVEYSALKFYRDHQALMDAYDIRDEYELHNLLKKVWDREYRNAVLDDHHKADFSEMPLIRFGQVSRSRQILALIRDHGPIKKWDLITLYEKEYGVGASIFMGNNDMEELAPYFVDGKYEVNPGSTAAESRETYAKEAADTPENHTKEAASTTEERDLTGTNDSANRTDEQGVKETKESQPARMVQDQYFAWLQGQVSGAKLSDLYMAYGDIEKFCQERGIIRGQLFALANLADIRKVTVAVESNRIFRLTYKYRQKTMLSAMQYYYRFMKEHPDLLRLAGAETEKAVSAETMAAEKTAQKVPPAAVVRTAASEPADARDAAPQERGPGILEETKRRYAEILSEQFSENGYKVESSIFRARFKKYYEETYGCAPEETNERIDAIMGMVGVRREGKIWPHLNEGQNDLIETMVQDVLGAFALGATAVYVEAVFDKYRRPLADDLRIYNQQELESLLMDHAEGRYIRQKVRREAVLTKKGGHADPEGDLLRFMKTCYEPQTYAAIHEKVWFIPYTQIQSMLNSGRIEGLIYVAEETYFYAPNLPVSAGERAHLISLIHGELDSHHFMTGTRLQQLIEEQCPAIAIDTEGYTDYGLRNCLGYLLRDQFAFNGPVITAKGDGMGTADVFAEFAKDHEKLTVDELERLAGEWGLPVYWEAVLGQMVRVSKTQLVRNDQIAFDVEATDAMLETLCPGDYVPIQEVELFLSFPTIVGYSWNAYMLASYLFTCSRKFCLEPASFAKTGVYGAMARRSAGLDYQSILVDALSKSDALANDNTALQYIVDKGYQKRRSYAGIGSVLKKARLLKERREKGKK